MRGILLFLIVTTIYLVTIIQFLSRFSVTLSINNKTIGQLPQRKIVHEETSPDGEKKIVLYEVPFTGKGDVDYRNYLANQYLFSVETFKDGTERQIFINDYKTGSPHWLGNNHIFFTHDCGSGCEGIYLVNVDSKTSRLAEVITDPLAEKNSLTRFYDWFDQDFKFSGWVKHMRSAFIDNNSFFILDIQNADTSLTEKKFLFTKDSLKLIN
ncbi:hypothetical protein HY950_02815 [Candidatus Gottesmanbacteria bacterium]|nr:hypothetical protein [Candidatus Gottesmanbacteria bacterium]